MTTLAFMSGFFAAHGIWSISDGDTRAPFVGTFSDDGRPALEHFRENRGQTTVSQVFRAEKTR
jgi:hypothetical protein